VDKLLQGVIHVVVPIVVVVVVLFSCWGVKVKMKFPQFINVICNRYISSQVVNIFFLAMVTVMALTHNNNNNNFKP